MKLVMHIGMGKTGTSSIQRALATNQQRLAAQRAAYLGMWFDAIDPSFEGLMGQRHFAAGDAEQMHDRALALRSILERRAASEGIETFVFSNEAIFPSVATMTPFLAALGERLDLRLVTYLRDPRSWLPSADAQWGIRHKVEGGPIRPFPERARTLIENYEAIRAWVERFPDILVVRRFEKGADVVADFAAVAGVALEAPGGVTSNATSRSRRCCVPSSTPATRVRSSRSGSTGSSSTLGAGRCPRWARSPICASGTTASRRSCARSRTCSSSSGTPSGSTSWRSRHRGAGRAAGRGCPPVPGRGLPAADLPGAGASDPPAGGMVEELRGRVDAGTGAQPTA